MEYKELSFYDKNVPLKYSSAVESTESLKGLLCTIPEDIDTVEAKFTYDTKFYSDDSYGIRDVVFRPPATIVYWQDGTQTVVVDTEPNSNWKTIFKHDENIEWIQWKERGLMNAIMKKYFDKYLDVIDAWIK